MTALPPTLLPEMPSLSKMYVNGAAMAARNRVLGSSSGNALPQVGNEVRGVLADLAKLTAYQHLLGKTARDAMPSGFLHALAFPVAMSVMVRGDFPLPLLGMLHLRNHVDHLQPILFTQPLAIRAWAQNLAGHRSGTLVDLVVEIRAEGTPAVLWRGVSTYLAKGIYLPGVDKRGAVDGASVADFSPPDPTGIWKLGVDTGRAYAAVSGDFNPIHLSVISAKALGLRRSIAHGMYLGARVLADVGSPQPDAFAWDISFEAPVFLPATVAMHIADVQTDDGGWLRSDYVGWNPRTGRRHFTGSVAAR
ncbi:MAG: hypothetical protein M3017_03070 [Actinomycetota bacterium]|nr:hypothetical protein [Actinomycetota bacterium]